MATKKLDIDLTGKTLEEVLKILQDNDYSVSARQTTMWDVRAAALSGKKESWPPVHIIWIKDEESPLLTVTIFNGEKVTLKPGMDLHLFTRAPDDPPGEDWAAVNTLNFMR